MLSRACFLGICPCLPAASEGPMMKRRKPWERKSKVKFAQIALTVLLSAAVAFGVGRYAPAPSSQQAEAKKETRLEQIKRTGTLRCGYYIWPPFIEKDMVTGQMKGLFVEAAEELGRQLGVKVEWVTEIVHANVPVDLANNRYDMLGGVLFATPSRAREMDFVAPLVHHPVYIIVRADDARFDNNYAAANDPSVKISTIEGEFSDIAANEHFPRAQKVALPQNSNGPEMLLNVANGKADIAVTELVTFNNYNKNNPGKLRLAAGPPESVMAAGFPIPQNEPALKNALDATMAYLHGTGFVNKLLDKYETPDNKFLRMPKPYLPIEEGKKE